jgi:hypothetical protein
MESLDKNKDMKNPKTVIMPENFPKIMSDMTDDLSTTFPEYAHLIYNWTTVGIAGSSPDIVADDMKHLFEFCLTMYPARFFDILYQNDSMFSADSEIDTMFLPTIDFKNLFACPSISSNTRSVLWKYLQLVLFTVVGSIQDKTDFGDAEKMFDGIDEIELQNKLNETIKGMSGIFKFMEGVNSDEHPDTSKDGDNSDREFSLDGSDGIPSADEVHGHIKGIFDGKIGSLAKELAADLSKDLSGIIGEDMGDVKNTKDVLHKLMQNPGKISELVKTVTSRLGEKMKSGDISHDDILREASELMEKMR